LHSFYAKTENKSTPMISMRNHEEQCTLKTEQCKIYQINNEIEVVQRCTAKVKNRCNLRFKS